VGVTALLLDTHVLLGALLDPARIPADTLAAVRAPGTRLYVSAASAWEIATKHRLGELDDAAAVVSGYPEHLDRLRAEGSPSPAATHSLPDPSGGPTATRSTG
jgi:PIN domain nuclease of toxin-antitoxin system